MTTFNSFRAFQKILRQAIRDVSEHGFDSQERMDRWMSALRLAASTSLMSVEQSQNRLAQGLRKLFSRFFRKKTHDDHKGVDFGNLGMIEPRFRPILDRRIMVSADLIKLNRDQAIEMTLRRFSGWMSSVPIGGSDTIKKADVAQHIWKPLRSSSYEERRLLTDQGHKLMANINATVADQYGAIAFAWHHVHSTEKGYKPRPEHLARDGEIFAIRGSWADKQGLISRRATFNDQIDMPGEYVYCRCTAIYLYTLNDLPAEMLTKKGRKMAEESKLQ